MGAGTVLEDREFPEGSSCEIGTSELNSSREESEEKLRERGCGESGMRSTIGSYKILTTGFLNIL